MSAKGSWICSKIDPSVDTTIDLLTASTLLLNASLINAAVAVGQLRRSSTRHRELKITNWFLQKNENEQARLMNQAEFNLHQRLNFSHIVHWRIKPIEKRKYIRFWCRAKHRR
jgi:hypothetical protein